MKKIVLILMVAVFANAKCYKAPCYTTIQSEKASAISRIEQAYNKNNDALNKLEQAYEKYKNALDNQNKLLTQIQIIKAESLLEEKQLLYKLKKHNDLRSKNIDIKNNKEKQ